jgi:MFS family permease
MASQVFGSLFAALVLQSFDLKIFYLVMSLVAVLSGVIFYFLKQPILVASEESNESHDWREDFKETFKLIIDKKMLIIAPKILWTGISLSIQNVFLVKMIAASVAGNDINQKIMKSLLTLMSLGLGEIVGSLSIGPIIDRYPSSVTTYITFLLIIL